MTPEFDEFTHDVMVQAREWVGSCEPDEDPPPTLFILHDDSCQVLHCGGLFNDSQGKAIFAARVMPHAIRRWEADYFALLTAQWRFSSPDPRDWQRYEEWARENPDASMEDNPIHPPSEEITVVAGARDGRFMFASAITERHEGAPPTLGEWEVHEENWLGERGAFRTGPMFDFAMEAITGATLFSEDSIAALSGSISTTTYMKESLMRAWDALGWGPEEAMRRYHEASDSEKELLAEQVRAKLRELDPDWENTVRGIVSEHLQPASEQYLQSRVTDREGGVILMDEEGNTEVFELLPSDSPDDLLDDG